MKKLILLPALLSGLVATAGSLPAQVMLIAEWNFNNLDATITTNGFGETVDPDNGTGSMFVQSATTTGTNFDLQTTDGTTLGAWDSEPAGGRMQLRRGERWNNGYVDLSFSMVNRTDLTLSFALNITNTAPTTTTLRWSNDGGANFTNFATLTHADDSPANVYSLFVYDSDDFDFSALDNQSNVVVRFQFSDGGGPGSGGASFLFDNIVVTAIPEPSTYAALFGLLALAGVFIRRRMR